MLSEHDKDGLMKLAEQVAAVGKTRACTHKRAASNVGYY